MDVPLIDTIDIEILMHRDIHFGRSFDVMLEYYANHGCGTMPDFSLSEIEKLKDLEKEMGQNLSDLYINEGIEEIVKRGQKLYQDLRAVYSTDNPDPKSVLLSDLILTEEEVPKAEIEALANQGSVIVPELINLLLSHTFYDPLNPGYGRTPIFAAMTLAKIQDERAIPPLFQALGQENFFTDEEIIKALKSFGEKSKQFLIKVLKQKPYSKDNELAAIALNDFSEDPQVGSACLEELNLEETQSKPMYFSYLTINCTGLTDEKERETFILLSQKKDLPKELKDEMSFIIKSWKN